MQHDHDALNEASSKTEEISDFVINEIYLESTDTERQDDIAPVSAALDINSGKCIGETSTSIPSEEISNPNEADFKSDESLDYIDILPDAKYDVIKDEAGYIGLYEETFNDEVTVKSGTNESEEFKGMQDDIGVNHNKLDVNHIESTSNTQTFPVTQFYAQAQTLKRSKSRFRQVISSTYSLLSNRTRCTNKTKILLAIIIGVLLLIASVVTYVVGRSK